MIASRPEISSRQQRANLSVLTATAFLRGAHTSVYGVIWQPFVLSLGASMPTVGLLNSLGGMGGFVATLVQSLGGRFADRVGRVPLIIASSVAFLAAYTFFAAAGALAIWMLLLLGVVSLGLSALARPATSSMTAESVRADQHGSAFSLIVVAGMVPGIVAPVAGGWIADRFGYISIFPLAVALELIVLVLVWRHLSETRPTNLDRVGWGDVRRALQFSIVPPKGLGGFFCANAADSFAWGMGWGLLNGMLRDTLNFSVEQLGIMTSVMSLTWAIVQMPVGKFVDRRGTKAMMIFSEAIGIPLMLIWITQSRFEVFVASEMLFALTAATWVPIVSTYLARRVSPAERAEAFGRLNAFRGVVAFPAPALGGLLYAWGGMRAPLIANLIGIFVVMVILALFVQEPRDSERAPNSIRS